MSNPRTVTPIAIDYRDVKTLFVGLLSVEAAEAQIHGLQFPESWYTEEIDGLWYIIPVSCKIGAAQ